jgi:hypothetical protein
MLDLNVPLFDGYARAIRYNIANRFEFIYEG